MVGDLLQPTHLLFVLVVALLVLGPKRLPEVARTLGNGLRDFRAAINGEHSDDDDPPEGELTPYVPPAVDEAHTNGSEAEAEPAAATGESVPEPAAVTVGADSVSEPSEPSEPNLTPDPVVKPLVSTSEAAAPATPPDPTAPATPPVPAAPATPPEPRASATPPEPAVPPTPPEPTAERPAPAAQAPEPERLG